MTLPELQAALVGYISGETAAAALVPLVRASERASAAECLDVYAVAFRRRWRQRLMSVYPITSSLIGPRGMLEAATEHVNCVNRIPSPRPDAVRAWSSFLRETPPVPDRPDLGDLAALELARGDVADAADASAVGPEALAGLDAEAVGQARLRFVPAVQVVRTSFDVAEVWAAAQAGAAPPPPAAVPTEVVVWRQGPEVMHAVLDPSEARALRAAMDGEPLSCVSAAFAGEAAPDQAAYDALAGWFLDGFIAAVVSTEDV
jgi:hypothetical protein